VVLFLVQTSCEWTVRELGKVAKAQAMEGKAGIRAVPLMMDATNRGEAEVWRKVMFKDGLDESFKIDWGEKGKSFAFLPA